MRPWARSCSACVPALLQWAQVSQSMLSLITRVPCVCSSRTFGVKIHGLHESPAIHITLQAQHVAVRACSIWLTVDWDVGCCALRERLCD
jgi:hypothetical protein